VGARKGRSLIARAFVPSKSPAFVAHYPWFSCLVLLPMKSIEKAHRMHVTN
jgi:hypothetical protein